MSETDDLLTLLQDGRVEEAVAAGLKADDRLAAAELFNDFATTLRNEMPQNVADAEMLWKAAAKLNPDAPEVFYNLGVLLSEPAVLEKRPDAATEAVAYYLAALELNPTFDAAHYNLGLLYTYLGLYEEAQNELTELKSLQGEDGEDYLKLKTTIEYRQAVSR